MAILAVLLLCRGAMADETEYRFKLASLAPKSVGWARHLRSIITPAVKKATDGKVKLKWYWGGVMGNDRDYLEKMRIGQLHGAAFTGRGVVLACPEMAVLGLPFLFNDYGEVDYIREKMRPVFDRLAEKRGYKLVVWSDQDFDQIYSVKFPMDRLADFGKARFLTWNGPMEQKLLKILGASPIPVNVTELTPSVRQGIGDTLMAPALWMVGSQLYTTVKHVNPVKIRYSPAAVFVTLDAWRTIPEAYRAGILSIRGREAVTFRKKTRTDNRRSLAAMIDYGVKPSAMEPGELARLRQESRALWARAAGEDFPEELLTELSSHLADYRQKRKEG